MMEDEDPNVLHRQAWHAMPWVVNGTASREDEALLMAHAATCADCRDELALQRRLQAAMAGGEATASHEPDPGPALARLWDRIDQEDAQAAPTTALPVGSRWTRWLVAAVVLQAVGLTALIGLQWQRAPAYVTLSQAPARPGMATIRLVPSPAMRQGDLQALLKAHGLRIVEVNEDGGILGLAPVRVGAGPARDELLARLRAEAGVLLAEPVGAP